MVTVVRQGSKSDDVLRLQKLLNQAGANPRLTEDKDFGKNTHDAVVAFQQAKKLTPVDGIAGRDTWNALGVTEPLTVDKKVSAVTKVATNTSASGISKVGFICLPSYGVGFYSIGGPDKHWGTPTMINFLLGLGVKWAAKHPNGPRIGINDISFKNGGTMAPHKSHKNGRGVDIRLLRTDGKEMGGLTYNSKVYSLALNKELLELMASFDAVSRILFNDSRIQNSKRKFCSGHDNHYHIDVTS